MKEKTQHQDQNMLFLASIMMSNQHPKLYPFNGTEDAEYRDYLLRQEAHLKEMMKMVVRCYHETYLPLIQEQEALQNKEQPPILE